VGASDLPLGGRGIPHPPEATTMTEQILSRRQREETKCSVHANLFVYVISPTFVGTATVASSRDETATALESSLGTR
jgi:hypothetical protein